MQVKPAMLVITLSRRRSDCSLCILSFALLSIDIIIYLYAKNLQHKSRPRCSRQGMALACVDFITPYKFDRNDFDDISVGSSWSELFSENSPLKLTERSSLYLGNYIVFKTDQTDLWEHIVD